MAVAKKRTELFVGLFLFIGFGLLGGLVLQFGKFSDQFRDYYPLTVVFDDATGVIKGSEVRMGGAIIGYVTALPELNDVVRAEVPLSIRENIRIPVDSTIQINSATLLGDKLIVVIPPEDRSPGFIEPGSRLDGAGPTGLDALQDNAVSVGRDARRIMKKAEATLVKMDDAVSDIQLASKQVGAAVEKINQSLLTDKNVANIGTTLENLTSATAKWKEAGQKLDPMLAEARDAIHEIRTAAKETTHTLKTADETLAGVKPALERIPKAADEFSSTAAKAGKTLDRINRGEGLLGALAADNDVALDAKAFMRNLKNYGILLYRNPDSKSEESNKKSRAPSYGHPNR